MLKKGWGSLAVLLLAQRAW